MHTDSSQAPSPSSRSEFLREMAKNKPRGEAFVWFTASGLAVGLVMIVALLAMILGNGLEVFWPKRVVVLELREGSPAAIRGAASMGGELVKHQRKAVVELDDAGQPLPREYEYQLFVGNKDAYGFSFRFVDEKDVVAKTWPCELMVAERVEYGDLIFIPVRLETPEGKIIEATEPKFLSELERLVEEGNRRRADILTIEKHRIGDLNSKLEALRLEERAMVRRGVGESDPALQALAGSRAALQEAYGKLAAEALVLRNEQRKGRLHYRLVTGEERTQEVAGIIFFYAANDIGTLERLGIFFRQLAGFFLHEPREANTEGGIFPAIFGTFVMTLLLSVAVTPVGVLAAIYLREYAKQGFFVRAVRIAVNNLAGVPSIVFGVFGLGFFVYGMGSFLDGGSPVPMPARWWWVLSVGGLGAVFSAVLLVVAADRRDKLPVSRPLRGAAGVAAIVGVCLVLVAIYTCPYFKGFFSLALPTPTFGTGGILWASLTLALMTVPVVIVATEEALSAVPRGVREGSLACGASKWQTIQRLVLPASAPGILTGLILAMARGAGEVAPLMLVGVVKLAPTLPVDTMAPFLHLDRKFMHLGFHIYDLGFQSPDSEAAKPMVFATTFVLILLVVVLNLSAILIRNHLRKKYKAGIF